MHLRLLIFLVLVFELCVAFILADDLGIKVDNGRRTKRGLVDGSSKLLGKGGKFAARLLRVFKAHRVLLKDAELIHADSRVGRLYEKAGGRARAEKDFMLTFPTNIKVIDVDDDGPVKMGIVENYKVMLKYWTEEQEIENIGETTRYTIMMVKSSSTSRLEGRPMMVHYL